MTTVERNAMVGRIGAALRAMPMGALETIEGVRVRRVLGGWSLYVERDWVAFTTAEVAAGAIYRHAKGVA